MSKFWGAMVMTIGAIIALTCGLCSFAFVTMIAVGNIKLGAEAGVLIGLIVIGFLCAAVGFWLFRRGLARIRRDA